MKKENKKYLGVSLSALAFSLSYGLTANAQTCVTPPSCETLGYTDTADKCDGDAMIKCPFDTSKVFCRSIPTTKVCDTIGDIIYDDKSCAIDIDNLDPNRTPIGVVFDVSRKLAVALEQSSSELRWASRNGDEIPELPNANYGNQTNDYNGKSNTSIIIAHGDSNGYETPAADYTYNYVSTGTNKGDWYLPAAGELYLIYQNKTTLNSSLSKIGRTLLSVTSVYWSSSEASNGSAYKLYFGNGMSGTIDKKFPFYVRPVLAY